MATIKIPKTRSLHATSLVKRMLLGAGLAAVLIALLLLRAGTPEPAWPAGWMIRPLIIVPLTGATVGAIDYYLDRLRQRGRGFRVLANIASLLIYLVGLWMGTILGLNGTMWN